MIRTDPVIPFPQSSKFSTQKQLRGGEIQRERE